VLVLGCLSVGAAELTAEQKGRVRADLESAIPGLVAKYQLADALERDGIGRSDAKTSGGLGWGEQGYLRRYMMCYFVTKDTYWLDKVIDHFDRMVGNLSDHDGDGLLSWQAPGYSVGLVEVQAQGDVGGLAVATPNGDRRVYVGRGGENITGHEYLLEFTSPTGFRFTDTTDGKELGAVEYRDPTTFDLLPGTDLKVTGVGKQGAKFAIKTTAPQPCEYQVHDGMVTYPVAQFIGQVQRRDDLDPKYREKADAYLKLLDEHFVKRWEKTWVEVLPDAGLYVFTDNPTQRFPGYSLPHNQYLAPARTCLTLSTLKGYPGAALCAERARRMATYFKRNLRLTDKGAYVWNYWDPLPNETDVKPHIEDIGHGTIDIGFAVAAAHRSLVFTSEDLDRLARTYVDVMWNGDKGNPRFGARVDTNQSDKGEWWEWIRLAQADFRVWELALALFERSHRATSMAVPMVALYDELVGVDDATAAKCRENTAKVLELTRAKGILNPSFEVQSPAGESPVGWALGTWNPDGGSETAWVPEAHEGGRAIALIGKGDPVNVWAQSDKSLPVKPPAKIALAAFYKAEPGTRPTFSILAFDAAGARVQYETSPAFEATGEWKKAEWTKELDPKARSVTVMLRNHARGRVVWDEVEAE
jgi:hypothetical protein